MMPALQLPRTDVDRALLLEQALTMAKQDTTANRPYVSAAWQTSATAFATNFGTKARQLSELLSVRGREVAEKDAALDTLETYVRDFWAVLERRIDRLGLPASLFQLYNLPQNGQTPKDSRAIFWIETGRELVKADALAVLQGYTAMSNPSAAELDAVVASAEKEFADVPVADREIELLQLELTTLRPQADKLIKALNAQLEASLYELSDEALRRVKRSYGFEFYTRPGEPVESPEDVVETAPVEVPAAA
jgi:hypothetical protein